MNALNAWWNGLAQRERRMMLAGAVVLSLGLFYGLVWAPLQRGITLRSERVTALRDDLKWMRGAAVRLAALRAQQRMHPPPAATPAGSSSATLAERVAVSARTRGLAGVEIPAGESGSGDALKLVLKPVPFATLMPWLASLQAQGIQVPAFKLQAAGAGMVQGEVELARAKPKDGGTSVDN